MSNEAQRLKRELSEKQAEIETRNNVIKEMDGRLNKVLAEKAYLESKMHERPLTSIIPNSQQNSGQNQALQIELGQAKVELTTLKQENLALKHKVDSLQGNAHHVQKLQTENADLKQKAENIGRQLLSQMSNKSNSSVELEKLKLDNSFLKQNLDALKSQIANLNSSNQSLKAELDATKEFLAMKEGQQEDTSKIRAELAQMKARLENAKDEVVEMARKANSAIVEKEQVEREMQSLKDNLESLKEKTKGSTRNIQVASQENDQLKIQISMLREEVIEAKLKAESLESKLQDKEKELTSTSSENALIKLQYESSKKEIDSLKSQVRQSMASTKAHSDTIESEKHHLKMLSNLEEQVTLHKESEARHTKQIELLTEENKGLQSELKRITALLEQASSDQKPSPEGQKYSASGFRQLEGQVINLETENRKLREEKNSLKIDAERLKTCETKNRELRAELDMSKHRMEYLESELTRKREEVTAAKDEGQSMVQKLRDEIRHMRENEANDRPIHVVSPQMSPMATSKSNTRLTAEGIEEKQTKDKLHLEIGLAKAEKEIKDKDARIIGLESRIGDLSREIEKIKYTKANTQAAHLEESLKKENLILIEKLNDLQARESQLRESESNKDRLIAQLQSAIKDQALNSSLKHE